MHKLLGLLTSLSLLCPIAVRAADVSAVSVEASLQLLGDHKENTNTVSRSRRFLQSRNRARIAAQNARKKYRRPSMLNRAFNTYVNEGYGIRMGYPGNWKVLDAFMSTVVSFLSPQDNPEDAISENMNILVERYEPGVTPTLHESTAKALKQLQQLKGFTIVEKKDTIVGFHPAVSMVYTAGGVDQTLKFKQVWTIHKNALYIFTFAASPLTYKDYAPAFEKMMSTLTLE